MTNYKDAKYQFPASSIISGDITAARLTLAVETKPVVSSVAPSTITNEAQNIVITGTDFVAIPRVDVINTATGIWYSVNTVTRDSATQLTVNLTLGVDAGTYRIRVENPDGLAGLSAASFLTVSDAPVWTTGAGSLGSVAGDFSGTVATVAATGDTVTFTETTNVLTNSALANCAISSAGVITTSDFDGSSTTARTHTFTIRATDAQSQTTDREFTLTSLFTYTVDWLVVAGGAGGACAGGGGAGGFRAGASLALTPANVYTVAVGAGGLGKGAIKGLDGGDSILSGTGITTVTSTGGGGGAPQSYALGDGRDGGSGGGEGFGRRGTVSPVNTVGAGNTPAITPITGETTTVQGFAGGLGYSDLALYTGGGPGGGASEVGADNVTTTAGDGGDGTANSITGSSVTYAGGGGGAVGAGHTSGSGGAGGGGNGITSGVGVAGGVNTGGGGGGSGGGTSLGGNGGSGVIILRMLTADYSGTTSGSPTVTTDGSYTVIKFTGATGSYTA